jgi:hypothetical protein
MSAQLKVVQEQFGVILHPFIEKFVEWFMECLSILVDHVILPMQEVVKEQSKPMMEYISNRTSWFVPMLVIGWYGPAVVMVALQCVFICVMIIIQCFQCCSCCKRRMQKAQ